MSDLKYDANISNVMLITGIKIAKKNPAIMQDLDQCPRLDSNQHAVSSATTSR